jgi:hypothetical protein
MTGCRLGGCGPVAVMRTGLHLGGSPGIGPAPTLPVKAPVGALRPPPAPTGVSHPPRAIATGPATRRCSCASPDLSEPHVSHTPHTTHAVLLAHAARPPAATPSFAPAAPVLTPHAVTVTVGVRVVVRTPSGSKGRGGAINCRGRWGDGNLGWPGGVDRVAFKGADGKLSSRNNSIGGDRLRLWLSSQVKRVEGRGGDLVNTVTTNYKCQLNAH